MTPESSHGRARGPVQKQQRSPRTRIAPRALGVLLLFSLVVAFSLLGAANALAITRDTVLARAQTWVDSPVPYSQTRYFGGYRTDCSGYVSMCWKTGTSWSTRTFQAVSHRIAVDSLRPGDAMLHAGSHIRLFYGWADAAHTRYVTYEQTGPSTKSSIKSLATDLANGYVPFRYNGIVDSAPANNALANRSFDVWASDAPVWWTTGGEVEPAVVRRKDVYRTAHNSVEFENPTADARAFAELEQTATVTPDTTYTLSAWARTAGDPRSLELRLRYRDGSGRYVSDTRTAGEPWGVGAAGFAQMSVTGHAPEGAVTAVVTVRLAGGTDASGTAGNSAVLDDVSLTRPQTTISIATAATSTYLGRTVTLSGAVTPTTTIGTNVVVWVRKPATSRWSYSSNRTVYASGAAAAWQYKYYFKPGMAKGTYSYYAEAPALPGWLGSTSPTVSILVR